MELKVEPKQAALPDGKRLFRYELPDRVGFSLGKTIVFVDKDKLAALTGEDAQSIIRQLEEGDEKMRQLAYYRKVSDVMKGNGQ